MRALAGPLVLLFLTTAQLAAAQGSGVSGSVLDAHSLRPLEGAVISVEGDTARTRSDTRGRFAISHLPGAYARLVVQHLGYRPMRRVVRVGDHDLVIILTDAALILDDMVVTGAYGSARSIGQAIAAIDTRSILQSAPTDLQNALKGVPGLLILPTQGNVGSGGRTRMRGVSSLSLSNEPIVYVDGVRVDNNPRAGPDIRNRRQIARINDFNTEDIERIEVLRGPAATTLYGTEASHGVIHILTRRGMEGPLRFGVTVKQGANWFMDPSGRLPVIWGRDSVADTLIALNLHQREVDAGRPIFQTGRVQTYGVTASGGTPEVRYFLSGNFDRDEGMVWYNWRRRGSARANVDVTPHERVSIQTSLGIVRNSMRLGAPAQTFDLMTQLVWGKPELRDSFSRGFRQVPPEVSAMIDSRAEITRFTGSVRLAHQPRLWLTHSLIVGTDVGDETSSRLFPRPAYGATSRLGKPLGELTVDRWKVTYATLDYLAAASFEVTPSMRSTTSLGAQYHSRNTRTIEIIGTDFPPGIPSLTAAAETEATEALVVNKTAGVFGQQQLEWKQRLFMDAALRVDDNSAFGPNFAVAAYPRFSASWLVRRGPRNAFRVRGAWGRAGQQPEPFAAVPSYQPVGGSSGSVFTPVNVGNPDLGPERTEELEVGLDAGFWDDRISVAFTYFRQLTRDAIATRSLAPSAGFSHQFVNVGLVSNRGIELAINTELLARSTILWDAGLTLSTNRNRVERLGGLPAIALAASRPDVQAYDAQYHQEGFPLGSYFMPKVRQASYDPVTGLQMICAGGTDLGHEDPTISAPCDDDAPRLYAGQPTPTWEGSVRTGVTLWNRLRLHGLVDFRGGHVMTNLDAGFAHLSARNTYAVNADSSDVDPFLLAYVRFERTGARNVNRRLGFMDASFAKLREVSLTYTFPPPWLARYGLAEAALTVAGRNLAMIWRAQRDIYGVRIADPEVGFSEDLNGRVQNALPQYAQVVTSLRLTF